MVKFLANAEFHGIQDLPQHQHSTTTTTSHASPLKGKCATYLHHCLLVSNMPTSFKTHIWVFNLATTLTPFSSDYLSSYLSLLPSPNDAVLSFGPVDTLLTPAQCYIPTLSCLYNLFPHPVKDSAEKWKYIAVLSSRYLLLLLNHLMLFIKNCFRNADVLCVLVCDMYTKSWSAFNHLVATVLFTPPHIPAGMTRIHKNPQEWDRNPQEWDRNPQEWDLRVRAIAPHGI